MNKLLFTVAALAGSASAFAPAASGKVSTAVNEFANGYVGGEGPEPIPFSSQSSSVNWDPAGFAEVGCTLVFRPLLYPSSIFLSLFLEIACP